MHNIKTTHTPVFALPTSEDARALLHYASHAREGCADDSDRDFCFNAARAWAEYIIGQTCATGNNT